MLSHDLLTTGGHFSWLSRARGDLDNWYVLPVYLLSMHTRPVVFGILFAIPTIGVDLVLPDALANAFRMVLLAAIAGIYVGFALSDGRPRVILLEASVALAFVLVAAFGGHVSLIVLALGYLLHGVWDLVHHPHAIPTRIVPWYPPFCAIYDWLIAPAVVAG
jgi:hypothetical protein